MLVIACWNNYLFCSVLYENTMAGVRGQPTNNSNAFVEPQGGLADLEDQQNQTNGDMDQDE
jgi:hypothetical protein